MAVLRLMIVFLCAVGPLAAAAAAVRPAQAEMIERADADCLAARASVLKILQDVERRRKGQGRAPMRVREENLGICLRVADGLFVGQTTQVRWWFIERDGRRGFVLDADRLMASDYPGSRAGTVWTSEGQGAPASADRQQALNQKYLNGWMVQ